MLRRILTLLKDIHSLCFFWLDKRSPEVKLVVEQENLHQRVAHSNQDIAAQAALCERLTTQVRKLETEEMELQTRTAAELKAGNQDAAGQDALRLQALTRELAETRTQLQQAEQNYGNQVQARTQAIQAARTKMDALHNRAAAPRGPLPVEPVRIPRGLLDPNTSSEHQVLAEQALADFAAQKKV